MISAAFRAEEIDTIQKWLNEIEDLALKEGEKKLHKEKMIEQGDEYLRASLGILTKGGSLLEARRMWEDAALAFANFGADEDRNTRLDGVRSTLLKREKEEVVCSGARTSFATGILWCLQDADPSDHAFHVHQLKKHNLLCRTARNLNDHLPIARMRKAHAKLLVNSCFLARLEWLTLSGVRDVARTPDRFLCPASHSKFYYFLAFHAGASEDC